MSRIKDVSGTAFVVAELRAEENDAARPLYRDSVVGLFLNEESRDARRAQEMRQAIRPVLRLHGGGGDFEDDWRSGYHQSC